jgi:hypothetical protein
MAGEFAPTRLADLNVPDRQMRPDYGSIPNYEALMLGTRGANGVLTGIAFGSLNAFVNTATVFPLGRPKTILILPSGTLTFPVGNVTARLIGARTPKTSFAGAASQVTAANYPDGNYVGPLVTLATGVTTLPNLGIWITPSSAAGANGGLLDLQWDVAHVALEINFVGGAPTQGNLAVVMFVGAN